jgi:Na+/alanine symporter
MKKIKFEIIIFTAKGGFLNFEAIFKMSDFAIFLPNLNNVISFFIIKFPSTMN